MEITLLAIYVYSSFLITVSKKNLFDYVFMYLSFSVGTHLNIGDERNLIFSSIFIPSFFFLEENNKFL